MSTHSDVIEALAYSMCKRLSTDFHVCVCVVCVYRHVGIRTYMYVPPGSIYLVMQLYSRRCLNDQMFSEQLLQLL